MRQYTASNSVKDPYGLNRFIAAQEQIYEQTLAEIHNGRKRTHWMWFIFPQLSGLGSSTTSVKFGIGSIEEARTT